MASPPPYGQQPPPNVDTRQLPPGWTEQYNWDYRQWFYVNIRENPPRSSWEHPLGPMQQQFSPPLGPPPPNRDFNRSPYGPPGGGYGGYGGGPEYQGGYNQGPPPGGYGGGYGGPPGGYGGAPGGGYGGGYQENRGYGGPSYGGPSPQPQTVIVEEQRKKKSGMGLGTGLLAGGAGLVGGALLMDAIEDHDQDEREEGYDQGFDQGEDYNDGGDFGGGDGGW